jgi:hypothetical protein
VRKGRDARQRAGELRARHVIGVAAEGGIAPGRVGRVGPRLAVSAQFGLVDVRDAGRAQAPGQRGATELGMAA